MNVNNYIDLACLRQPVKEVQVIDACLLGRKNKVKSVCVLPHHVKVANFYFDNVSTVIGYPYGTNQAKFKEAELAIADGARELDVVLNYSALLDGQFENLQYLVNYAHQCNVLVKLILETCFLSKICLVAACAHYDYVDMLKTSTGIFAGADEESISILLKYSKLPIKASGGIKQKWQAEKFLKIGCQRIGASCVF